MATAKKPSAMPKWRPAPAALVRTFEETLASVPEALVRKMFGYPAAFVNGQMMTGLHQENMILRLSDDDRTSFLKLPGARVFEPMPGRPMREYAVVPASMLGSPKQLADWLGRSLTYVRSLPPKAARRT